MQFHQLCLHFHPSLPDAHLWVFICSLVHFSWILVMTVRQAQTPTTPFQLLWSSRVCLTMCLGVPYSLFDTCNLNILPPPPLPSPPPPFVSTVWSWACPPLISQLGWRLPYQVSYLQLPSQLCDWWVIGSLKLSLPGDGHPVPPYSPWCQSGHGRLTLHLSRGKNGSSLSIRPPFPRLYRTQNCKIISSVLSFKIVLVSWTS